MSETFNAFYGNPDTPFYYGTLPTEELKTFLEDRKYPHTGEALDIGCGEGRNTLFLAQYGLHVHALDQSSHGIGKLKKYALSHNLQNIRYSIADVRNFPIEANFYDIIVAVTLLDHLNQEEGRKVASSILAALKPHGLAYIEVFTIHDPGATEQRNNNPTEEISETACFIKHYFEENELAAWFSELDINLYEEIMKYDDSHGAPHYHGIARLIGIKASPTPAEKPKI